jgi:protein-L-isoaspartate O-methyltransferase/8-oxo-dGTP pyrophosphatase MutT (NUDIX family)
MPRVGACVGVLFRDVAGRVLLVEPTYREDDALLLPGGSVEADGESPREAAEREVAEELGVFLPVGRVLAVDWTAAGDRPPLHATVFDGGVLDAAQIAGLSPGGDGEVARLVWADPRLVGLRMRPAAARRIEAALLAAETGAGALELVEGRITGELRGGPDTRWTPERARAWMVERLDAAGLVPSPSWRAALARFPREQFLPGVWAPRALPRDHRAGDPPESPGRLRRAGWTHLDGADDTARAEYLWRVYGGGPVIVDVDAPRPGTGRPGLVDAEPSLVTVGVARYVAALHALDVTPGCAVLELGVGAGLGAGLISAFMGDLADDGTGPRVTGVEIDPVRAQLTAERLEKAGLPVRLVVADALAADLPRCLAEQGTHAGPFDRIAVTFPVVGVPTAWLRLLGARGRLACFLTAGAKAPVGLLVVEADGTGAAHGTLTPVPPEPGDAGPPSAVARGGGKHAAAAGALRVRPAGIDPSALRDPGFALALSHLAPVLEFGDAEPLHVVDRDGGAHSRVVRRDGRWVAEQRRGHDLWARVEALHRTWTDSGSPSAFPVHVDAEGRLTIGTDGLRWVVPASPRPDTAPHRPVRRSRKEGR